MSQDWPSILTRVGLESTHAQFPDDVREAFSSAQGLVERMQAQPVFTDEPSHIFQAGRLSDLEGN